MDKFDILKSLQSKKNVLLMGAPGTGKSKLMNDVAAAFMQGASSTAPPSHQPGAAVPIPAFPVNGTIGMLSMLQKRNRKVFRTTLHQNSKYRDFLTGITPKIGENEGYTISKGILYRANEFAKQEDSAALLIIDELNRGPAIEVFGGSIVAIEPDKRLSDDNTIVDSTQFFEIINPESGEYEEYAFSPHLYILASMNQADVSVAPLDVAFLRRWISLMLYPDYSPIYERYGVSAHHTLNITTSTIQDVYFAAIKALETINRKITIGRGAEYQLGQGVFLSTEPQGSTINDALDLVLDCWSIIYAHIEELFFGEPNSIAYILNADKDSSPFTLEEVTFAGETRFVLNHAPINRETIFSLYCSLMEDD